MNILVDREARSLVYLLRLARGRSYYLAEPPVLGIIVIRWNVRIEELTGLVVDAGLSAESGVEGWCAPGYAGRWHGKMTVYRFAQGAAEKTLSTVIAEWRQRYAM